MTHTYLFYDLETTGLNRSFDQILQFAAIRTDAELNEIDRYEYRVRLNPNVIPSPSALITHRIPLETMQTGLHEYDVMRDIHQLFNTPGTISLGYNTLGFDDEFLRFSFYRHLLPPYTHQFANGCGRMDLYPILALYFLLHRDLWNWPDSPEEPQRISLKLEHLNQANAFVSGKSHHAMTDVLVTLALAKTCYKKNAAHWQALLKLFKKETDASRVHLLKNAPALCVHSTFGSQHYFQCPVLYLGDHPVYKHGLWLRLDLQTFVETPLEMILNEKNIIRKKPGEPPFIFSFNAQCMRLSTEQIQFAMMQYDFLKRHATFLNSIREYHMTYRYPHFPEADPAARLYQDGFLSAVDKQFCQQFHCAALAQKILLTEACPNTNLKILATRLLGRYHVEHLTPPLQTLFLHDQNAINDDKPCIDYRGEPRLNHALARQEMDILRKTRTLDDEQLRLLESLENYLSN